MASSVTAAERKVLNAKESVEKRTHAVVNATARLDAAREARKKAESTLKLAREDLKTIKKKLKPPTTKAKHIIAPKSASAAQVSVCTVCHKAAVGGSITMLECGCKFHQSCIHRWVKHGETQCPTCLAPEILEA